MTTPTQSGQAAGLRYLNQHKRAPALPVVQANVEAAAAGYNVTADRIAYVQAYLDAVFNL